MKNLIRLVYCVVFVSITHSLGAQSLFVPGSFNTAQDEEAFAVAELPDGKYVFAAKKAGPSKQSGDAFLFLTDNSGTVLRSQTLLKENVDTAYFSLDIFLNTDYSISVFGLYYNKSTKALSGIFCLKTDTNFTVISDKRIHLYTGEGINVAKIIQSGENMYSVISFIDNMTSPRLRTTKLLKFTPSGDTLATINIDSTFFGFHQYFSDIPMGLSKGSSIGHFYLADCQVLSDTAITVDNPFDAGRFGIIKIDTNLKLLDSLQLNSIGSAVAADTLLAYNREVAACSEKNIIIGPFIRVMDMDIFKSYDGFGIAKYDLGKGKIVKNAALPYDKTKGSSVVNAQINSMSMRYDKVFGLGCYDCGFARSTSNSYFAVSCYDTNATLKWHHYFGGDAYYNASNIYACKDGDVMVMAVRYDHNPDNQRDFYIFKLDSASGMSTSITNVSAQLREQISLYPNPAQNELHIKGANNGNIISLCDVLGKQVLAQNLRSHDNVISIKSLAPGAYTFWVTSNEGVLLQSGKWVKE